MMLLLFVICAAPYTAHALPTLGTSLTIVNKTPFTLRFVEGTFGGNPMKYVIKYAAPGSETTFSGKNRGAMSGGDLNISIRASGVCINVLTYRTSLGNRTLLPRRDNPHPKPVDGPVRQHSLRGGA